MRGTGEALAARIRGELQDLDRVRERALRSWERFRTSAADEGPYLDSVAFNLHGFYSGVERLFELVARTLDGDIPAGDDWHRELIRRVGADLPGIRPAVVGPASQAALDELRRFRHVARNVYAVNLIPERVGQLVQVLDSVWPTLRGELLAIADFLEEAGRTD